MVEAAEYGLTATCGVDLGVQGVSGVVASAIANGRMVGTARQLAQVRGDLQCLVLVQFDANARLNRSWVIDGWSLIRAHGEGLCLKGAALRGALLCGARLARADLEEADLCGTDLEKADLSGANLSGANMAGSRLLSASLNGAVLVEAELCRADLRHADLRGADCSRTTFSGADLWNAYLWNVDLSKAFTERTDVHRANHLNDLIADQPRVPVSAVKPQ